MIRLICAISIFSLLSACGGSDPAVKYLYYCQHAIKQAAKNPSSADVPYTRGTAIPGGFRYHWARGDGLRLQNGFGAMMDATATCEVDSTQITSLTINGNKII